MFKILAIETFENSYQSMVDGYKDRMSKAIGEIDSDLVRDKEARYYSVMKVLASNQDTHLYKFYRDYKIDDNSKIKDPSKKYDNYFNECNGKETNKIRISLCAIVGKNGSGKSTLLELMIRILNNVAFALKAGLDQRYIDSLRFAECVYARLYFEDGEGHYCYIEQEDITIRWKNLSDSNKTWEYTHANGNSPEWVNVKKKLSEKDCRMILQSMFYTIVVNYSAYALNIEDFRSEWRDRDEEEIFTHPRNNPDEINQDEDLKEMCWIDSLFHKNDAYQTPIVLNPYREKGNIDVNKENSLLNDRLFLLLLDKKDMVTAILGGKEPCEFIFKSHEGFFTKSYENIHEATKVRDILKEWKSSFKSYYTNSEVITKKIISYWEKYYQYRFVQDVNQASEVQMAALSYIVYKTIKITMTYSKYRDFQDSFIIEDGCSHKVCEEKDRELEHLIMTLYCDMSHITLKIRRCIALLTFMHYGTKMDKDISPYLDMMDLKQFGEVIKEKVKNQKNIINELINKRKVESAYNGSKFKKYGLKKRGRWEREELFPAPCLKTSISLEAKDDKRINISFKEGESDIFSSERRISFESLSSGEKQLVYALGSTMYHLHNLNSVGKDRLQYPCVNIIIDEVDLYFHPEYQQQLIDRLIEIINSMRMKVIKHINIILATHSPFILSDIPKDNILYLEEGLDVSDKIKVNPLGANINDILHQSFFLKNGFMGDYIHKKIEELIKKIDKTKAKYNSDNIEDENKKKIDDEIREEIESIGDPFIREQLKILYYPLTDKQSVIEG